MTFLSPWNLIQAILFALGIWWSKEIFSRWREDLGKVREPDDKADRVVVLLLWSFTAVVLLLCVRFAWNIGWTVVHAIGDLR
ncbi:MAG: hypothetical protein ACREFR_01200 [Limisphaerales bacterium]